MNNDKKDSVRLILVMAVGLGALAALTYGIDSLAPGYASRIRLALLGVCATLLFAAAILFLPLIAKDDSQSIRTDLNAVWLSILDYAAEHRFIFSALLLICAWNFALVMFFGGGGESESTKTLADISLALFGGFATALTVLIASDYASKQFLKKKILDEGFEAVARALNGSPVFLNNYLQFGLVAWPSMEQRSITAEQDFRAYIARHRGRPTTVDVMNESGERWLNASDRGDTLLEMLSSANRRGIMTRFWG